MYYEEKYENGLWYWRGTPDGAWIEMGTRMLSEKLAAAQRELAAWQAARALPEDSIRPIDRDEEFDRTYIPLPGGWEVQTKGKGSTFRICDPSGRRLAIPPSPYLHETLERMAREIHSAMVRPVNGDSKTVNAELYDLAIALADSAARSDIECLCDVPNGKESYRWRLLSSVDDDDASTIAGALRYLSLREASGEPMPYKVIRDGGKVRFE